jgi:hypothetical protein
MPLEIANRKLDRDLYLITHRDKFHSAVLRQWLALCLESG